MDLAESGETKIGMVSPLPNPWRSARLGLATDVQIPDGLRATAAALATKSREAKGGQGGILQLC
jgi:hypothetical protein